MWSSYINQKFRTMGSDIELYVKLAIKTYRNTDMEQNSGSHSFYRKYHIIERK